MCACVKETMIAQRGKWSGPIHCDPTSGPSLGLHNVAQQVSGVAGKHAAMKTAICNRVEQGSNASRCQVTHRELDSTGASHRREPDVGGLAIATVARTPSPRKHKPVIDAAHARVLATSSGLSPCPRPQLMAVRVRFTSRVDAARATGPDGCRSDASRARGTADARSACL